MDNNLHFEEFEAAGRDRWREVAAAALKGGSIEKKLFSMTPEGIKLQPIYDQTDLDALGCSVGWPGLAPYTRGRAVAGNKLEGWWIAQDLLSEDIVHFNEQLSDELMQGRNTVVLPLDQVTRDWAGSGSGLALQTMADLQTALKGIDLQAAPLLTWAGPSGLPLLGMIEAALDGAPWRGAVLADPIGASLLGESSLAMNDSFNEMAQAAKWAAESSLDVRTIGVQGHLWGDAGANAVEELAFTLATAVEYLKAMVERGLSPSEIGGQFVFSLSLSSDIFMQTAKLRAARLLWSKVLSCFGDIQGSVFIHCRSCRFNKSLLDPHSNILRATAEAFAGVIGGANSLHLSPFDEVAGGNDAGARRLARNTQLLLTEECGFAEVADAAGGSWYVETLTDQLARKVWGNFQEIEKSGGMQMALAKGSPQQSVSKTAEERLSRMAQRREKMVGVNLSPDADQIFEQTAGAKAKLPTARAKISKSSHSKILNSVEAVTQAFRGDASIAEVRASLGRGGSSPESIRKLSFPRAAEGYEELRSDVVKYGARTGKRPAIWLAKFGAPKRWTARAEFARGFFGVGGYEILENIGGASTSDEALSAVMNTAASVVVLCATDEDYVEIVPDFVTRLKQKCPDVYVVLAGYPVDRVEEYQKAGTDGFIHLRAECLSFLQELNQVLGITEK
ncbi:MAG: methylmalonyl-CoA mutase family protein [Opitutaceae bacterium]